MRGTTCPEPIYVRWFSLQVSPTTVSFLASLLSPAETMRAQQFSACHLRRRYQVGRGYLRLVLASFLHCDPTSVQLSQTPGGKPCLDTSVHTTSWHFNLSHSGDFALLALTQGGALGVDVELVRPFPRALSLAHRFFSPSESHHLAHCAPPDQEKLFFQYWTAKEAFLKATGQGLGGGLSQVEVDLHRSCFLSLPTSFGSPGGWQLILKTFEAPYLGALAYAGAPRPLYCQGKEEYVELNQIFPAHCCLPSFSP